MPLTTFIFFPSPLVGEGRVRGGREAALLAEGRHFIP